MALKPKNFLYCLTKTDQHAPTARRVCLATGFSLAQLQGALSRVAAGRLYMNQSAS